MLNLFFHCYISNGMTTQTLNYAENNAVMWLAALETLELVLQMCSTAFLSSPSSIQTLNRSHAGMRAPMQTGAYKHLPAVENTKTNIHSMHSVQWLDQSLKKKQKEFKQNYAT